MPGRAILDDGPAIKAGLDEPGPEPGTDDTYRMRGEPHDPDAPMYPQLPLYTY